MTLLFMPRSDYSFDLPQHLIAQHPLESRTSSRLLYMNASTQFQDYFFINFPNLLNPGDLLVFNNTRVIPARLFGHKASGGKIEIFIERVLDEKRVLAQLRASQSPKPKTQLYLEKNINATVLQRRDNFLKMDSARYQTVYAQQPGAVAAPTAGLHFDGDMLEKIKTLGVEIAFITLHVGAGTFAPIRVDDIRQHTMHAERLHVTSQVCEQVKATRDRGGRVIAVGTTSVRALETASTEGVIKPYDGETRLFITPGYR